MPIQEKDLGKYKRPAIYINKIDNSIIELPAQNVLINLVPGFSKKGPYNTPVYVDNTVDFERIYGPIDKQLENKGSYFQRTCEKMLQTGPIWALNLLSTVPTRDVLNYVAVSTSSGYENSDFTQQYTSAYENFFNRQDFWVRDQDSFQDLVDATGLDPNDLLHLTNMGDKTITTFIWKSNVKGFDVTASDWYGGDTKVPTFIDPKSLISDYLVTVLILAGDWTDYKTLSVDTTWSKYFTLSGLTVTSVQDFVNQTGVVVNGTFDVSLIPNFQDLTGRDMYIESVLNNNTDQTSLFCTYNQDLLLDNDNLSDLVDLIGNTIVGTDTASISFLSYEQPIKETNSYPLVNLDSPNNVFGTTNFGLFPAETFDWNNWTQTGITIGFAPSYSVNYSGGTLTYTAGSYIINGVEYQLPSGSTSITTLSTDTHRLDVLYLDSNGLHIMDGYSVPSGTTITPREITFTNENTIILGTLLVTNTVGVVSGVYNVITDIVGNTLGVIPIIVTTGITGTETYLQIEFSGTSGSTLKLSEYSRLRSQKVYNEIATYISLDKGVIISTTNVKTPIIDPLVLGYTTTSNDKIIIYLTTPSIYTSGSTDVLLYYVDKQFKLDPAGITVNTPILTTYDLTAPNIVATYSSFYIDFYNGVINNGDYIIENTVNNHLTMYIDSNGVLTAKFVDHDVINTTSGLTILSDIGNWRQTIEIEAYDGNDSGNTVAIYVDMDRYSEITRGMYLEANYDVNSAVPVRKLVRIVNIKNDTVDTTRKIIYTDGPIRMIPLSGTTGELYTTSYPAVYNYVNYLKGIALKPFIVSIDSVPDGTEAKQNTILNVISKNTPIYKGLINKNKIAWRYLVDTFGLGLTEESKQQYVDLCGDKLNCVGFISMPSAKQFKKSTNPSFTADDGSLSSTYIKEGGNPNKNPSFLYSFGTGTGRSTVGYFFPYVKVTDSTNISSFAPPAAYVATAYMRKFTTATAGIQPWTIVAGVNTGRLPDISGTEIDFTNDDLDNFSDMGCNPIVFIRNVGYTIGDENTAQVFPVSSLSYLHSREVLIELENQLYDMLLRYQWKFNTPTIRSEIKYRADRICQSFVDSVGLYAYRNVIDETNNTPYIIDLQGGVLDTYVEIVKGMGWIVNNITIEKTGTINSTGFQQ